MNKYLLPFLLVLATSDLLADDFKTIQGKEYKNVTVSRVEPDGIVLRTSFGISKVYFGDLPKDVQEKYHYDPPKAALYPSGQAGVVDQSPLNQQPASVAQVGETRSSIEALLGKPLEDEIPAAREGLMRLEYQTTDWYFAVTYVREMCTGVKYAKADWSAFSRDELNNFLRCNAQGYEWVLLPGLVRSRTAVVYLRQDGKCTAIFGYAGSPTARGLPNYLEIKLTPETNSPPPTEPHESPSPSQENVGIIQLKGSVTIDENFARPFNEGIRNIKAFKTDTGIVIHFDFIPPEARVLKDTEWLPISISLFDDKDMSLNQVRTAGRFTANEKNGYVPKNAILLKTNNNIVSLQVNRRDLRATAAIRIKFIGEPWVGNE